MLSNVAVALAHGVNAFELGVVAEVFGIDRSDLGLPAYDFAIVSGEPAPIRAHPGFTLDTPHGLERLAAADLIAVPAGRTYADREFPEELLEALRAAVARGAWVLSVCTGTFVLGAAGLLDGRRCTTHWSYTETLAERYPRATVESNVLYVEDGPVITSAGTAAGIDACLHLVRREQGSGVANAIARRMVVPPHREGGQAQYIDRPLPTARDGSAIARSLSWMENHLHEELAVEDLASRAHMSPRTYARRFRQETGTTPYQWLLAQRLLRARRLLEETELSIETVAVCTGFGTGAALRYQFLRRLKITPIAYRRAFAVQDGGTGDPDQGRSLYPSATATAPAPVSTLG